MFGMLGMFDPRGGISSGGGGGFSPISLFDGGEQGVWYDPSDFTTLFQDSAGTIPVTAVEQPVGKILDKSGNNNHALQPTSTARPVLSARVNQLLSTETLSTQSITTIAATYTLKFSGAGTITLSGTKTGTYSAGTNTLTDVTAGTLTLTVSGTVTQADIRVANDGAGLPDYQRVTTATDYDTTGFPLYLKFDGVDDCLYTTSINLTAADTLTLWAGIRKLDDVTSIVFETSANINTNNGTFQFVIASPTAGLTFAARGTVVSSAGPTTAQLPAPITMVLGTQTDISAPSIVYNTNNAFYSSVATMGTGNFASQPLYIGRRANSSLQWNGRMYSLIFINTFTSNTEYLQTQLWINDKTKAYA